MSNEQLDNRVTQLVRPEIRAINAYHVPPAQGMVKLDAMENPYRWPEDMRKQWTERLEEAELNRYPLPGADGVKLKLRQAMQIPEHYELMLGNGSDELIQIMAMAVAGSKRGILAPEPGFVMYSMIAKFLGLPYTGVPLTDDYELDLEAMLKAIDQEDPALIFLAQPNNPTGNLWGEEKIRRIIEASRGLVVIDEAYMAFTDSDLLPLLNDYNNVVVMRTLSKVGLAGLRLGILIGSNAWLNEFDKIRLPYNIGVLTQVSAEFALDHFDVLKGQTDQLRQDRETLFQALNAIEGFQPWPSEANFILVKVPTGRAAEIHSALKEQNILIKILDGAHPLLKDCLRITVSTPDENQALLNALKSIV